MSSLEISHLDVSFGPKKVIDDLSLSLAEGEIAALLGPSGCGKTTLLRSIAGLIQPSAGTIRFGAKLVGLSSVVLPPHRRGIGYVPQQGALFPHLSVAKNIAFGLDKKIYNDSEIKGIVEEMLELISMTGFEDRQPSEISGGQQTRVALARALAVKPKMVLLDEPFSALDAQLRGELRSDVVALLRAAGTTAILVTHDREEALVSADRVVLMRDGKIAQHGTPEDVYEKPASASIAISTGDALVLEGIRYNDGSTSYALHPIEREGGKGQSGEVVIRPEELQLLRTPSDRTIAGTISKVDYYGHDAVLEVLLSKSAKKISARIAAPVNFSVGDQVYVEHTGPVRFFATNK
jgi:iron(III) transport system ATP-binding protein